MAIAIAILCFWVLILVTGGPASTVIRTLLVGAWSSTNSWNEIVVKGTAITMCALAAAMPGRLGLINIGAEGQFLLGVLGAAWVAHSIHGLSHAPLLLAMAAGAFLLAGIWGCIPALLRVIARTNETVVSLLLNYVAALLVLYLIHGPWRDPAALGWAQGSALPDSALLPIVPGTRIHVVVLLAVLIPLILALAAKYTPLGITARIVAASPETAKCVGIKASRYLIVSFLIGAGIAGLGGLGEIAGVHGRLREGISLGYGYAGFLVAWVCGNRFEWIPVFSLLVGGIVVAGDGLQVTLGLPYATIGILQGLIFLAVVAFEPLRARALSGRDSQRFAKGRVGT